MGGLVLPHDMDLCHMNNARYLRECDFARLSLYTRNGVFKALRSLGGSMVVGATTIRLRRALCVGKSFHLRSRIITWDEKAFFLEQRFVSGRDARVSAVMYCKQNIIGSSPDKILQFLCKRKVGGVDWSSNCFLNALENCQLKQNAFVVFYRTFYPTWRHEDKPLNQDAHNTSLIYYIDIDLTSVLMLF